MHTWMVQVINFYKRTSDELIEEVIDDHEITGKELWMIFTDTRKN